MCKIKIIAVFLILFSVSCKKTNLKEIYAGTYLCECVNADGIQYRKELIFEPSKDEKDNLLYAHFTINNDGTKDIYNYTYLYLNEDGTYSDNNPYINIEGKFNDNTVYIERFKTCNCIKK